LVHQLLYKMKKGEYYLIGREDLSENGKVKYDNEMDIDIDEFCNNCDGETTIIDESEYILGEENRDVENEYDNT
jgi:hypothetical protein